MTMKKQLATVLIVLAISGCGGRTANPVMSQQYGDERKGCAALESELVSAQAEITRLMPQTDKTGKNVALGVAGAFFLVPWFFMDMSHAEQEEVNAYRQRYNHLASIAADKNCNVKGDPIPEFSPETAQKEKPAYPKSKGDR